MDKINKKKNISFLTQDDTDPISRMRSQKTQKNDI